MWKDTFLYCQQYKLLRQLEGLFEVRNRFCSCPSLCRVLRVNLKTACFKPAKGAIIYLQWTLDKRCSFYRGFGYSACLDENREEWIIFPCQYESTKHPPAHSLDESLISKDGRIKIMFLSQKYHWPYSNTGPRYLKPLTGEN